MTNWREREARVFMTTGRRVQVVFVRGEGSYVWDDEGKRYLDFFQGIAANSLGHCHPVVVKALQEQAATLIHVSNVYYTIPQIQAGELLIDNSCFDKIYFQNSGTESNEAAIKLARKWGKEKKGGAFEIITADDSFHGRTLAAVTATGTARYSEPFGPLPPGFLHVPFNDIEALQNATTPQTCAIMIEPIQGEGGINVPNASYLRSVREWCDSQNILLIADEVQTGMCRTGPLFAYQGMDFEPDVMTLAKGLGSGVPVGAILAKDHAAVFTPGDHGSTVSGNPLATAAAYAITKYMIENDVSSHVEKASAYLVGKLQALRQTQPVISEVRGKGLLLAIGLTKDIADKVVAEAMAEGLIVNNVRPNAIRMAPSLTLSNAEIDEAVVILEKAIARATAQA